MRRARFVQALPLDGAPPPTADIRSRDAHCAPQRSLLAASHAAAHTHTFGPTHAPPNLHGIRNPDSALEARSWATTPTYEMEPVTRSRLGVHVHRGATRCSPRAADHRARTRALSPLSRLYLCHCHSRLTLALLSLPLAPSLASLSLYLSLATATVPAAMLHAPTRHGASPLRHHLVLSTSQRARPRIANAM